MSDETTPETDRQRFIRNTGEDVRMMRARAVEQRRIGEHDAAQRIEAMAGVWERLLQRAEREERAQ
jgi:hypothetical protein